MRNLRMGVIAAIASVLAVIPGPAHASPTDPTVSGPLRGGLHGPWLAVSFDPADFGYTEEEFLVAGTARAYGVDRPDRAFTTRILVYRPSDPDDFSGDVNIEWNNVTGQIDGPISFASLAPHVMRTGDAYVQVTAQAAGACGLALTGQPLVVTKALSLALCTPTSIKGADPIRYAAVRHPGDVYAFDMFSQIAQAVKHPTGLNPLGELRADKVFAIGESQSAFMLDTYISNGADADAQIFDGFLLDADAGATTPTSFRVPTITIWSEESAQEGVPLTAPNHRIWSVAGASHIDTYALNQIVPWLTQSLLNTPRISKATELAKRKHDANYGQEGPGASLTCAGGDQFQRRYALDAALEAVQTWAHTGQEAPSAPPLQYSGGRRVLTSTLPSLPFPFPGMYTGVDAKVLAASPLGLAKDAHGNAAGGLRLPQIDVPVARYDGAACVLLGTTTPFSPATLHQLYPTHQDYVTAMLESTRSSLHDRFLTPADALEQMQLACESAIPDWGTTPPEDQPPVCHTLPDALSG